MNELSKEAVSLEHWAWSVGMRTTDGGIVVGVPTYSGGFWVWGDGKVHLWTSDKGLADERRFEGLTYPDLNDPGTRGHVLELVRKAWGCENIHVEDFDYWVAGEYSQYWRVLGAYGDLTGSTESEALICALKAAPNKADHE